MAAIQSHLGSFGVTLSKVFTRFGEEAILIILVMFLFYSWDKKFGKYIAVNMLPILVFGSMVKNLVRRRRPYFDHENVKALDVVEHEYDVNDPVLQGFSFPSLHAAEAASVYGSLPVYKDSKWLRVIGIVLPLLVGLSRIALGVHYPTDVLVGWVLGVLGIIILSKLQERVQDIKLYAIIAALELPGVFFCSSPDYFNSYGLMLGVFAGLIYEERKVNFENTRKPLNCILRIVGGMLVYAVLNTLLKKILPGTNLFGLFRYAVNGFVLFGIYPLIFGKIGVK